MTIQNSHLFRTCLNSPCNKVSILLVPKNASSTTIKICKYDLNWSQTEEPTGEKLYCPIQDPVRRWETGVIQYVTQYGMMEMLEYQGRFLTYIYDQHTFPIVNMYHDLWDQIEFIPTDIEHEYTDLLRYIFKRDGILRYDSVKDHELNVSKGKRDEFVQKLRELTEEQENTIRAMYYWDIKAYEKAVERWRNVSL